MRINQRKLNKLQELEIILLYKNRIKTKEIGIKYNISKSLVEKTLHRNGINLRSMSEAKQKYTINKNYFEKIDSEDKAYFLGFLYGDGCSNNYNNNINILGLESDKEIYEKLKKLINSNRPFRIKHGKNNNYILFDFANKKIKNDLYNLGIVPNKTRIIKFPKEHMDKSLYRHFIRGLFDSDGSIMIFKDKRCNRFYSIWNLYSTREMIIFIKEYLKSLSIEVNNIHQDKRCFANSAFLATTKAQNIFNIYHFMYDNATIFLERKKKKFENAFEIESIKRNIII